MNRTLAAFGVAAALVLASAVHAAGPEPTGPLAELAAANKAKDYEKIGSLAAALAESGGPRGKSEAAALAKELSKSLKICKRKWEIQESVVDAIGALGSKKGGRALTRLAFKDDVKEGPPRNLQVRSILALGRLRDPRMVDRLIDLSKNRSVPVAKAAYESLQSYGTATRGKVRRKVAEGLIKRIGAEEPRYSGRSTKYISAETYARWYAVYPKIVRSLQAVCREPTINDSANWSAWWHENENKRGIWKDDP